MRAFALIVGCVLVLATRAEAGPFEGSDDYKTHLEFLGYTVEEQETSLVAKHAEHFNVSLRAFSGGVLIFTFFGMTEEAKQDRGGALEYINTLNTDAVAGRYYVDDEDDLIIEAWYPGAYDRSRFGIFIDQFNAAWDQLNDESATERYVE